MSHVIFYISIMNAILIATFIMRKLFNSSNDIESKEKNQG